LRHLYLERASEHISWNTLKPGQQREVGIAEVRLAQEMSILKEKKANQLKFMFYNVSDAEIPYKPNKFNNTNELSI
jgi:hypothetical protein